MTDSETTDSTTAPDAATLLVRCRRATDDALRVFDGVNPSALDATTPCSGWSVRDLIGHLTSVCTAFGGALRGGSIDASVAGSGPGSTEDDPIAQLRVAAADAMREWQAPGALERTLQLPLGPTPAMLAIRLFTADMLIHAWDLARALGREHQLDEEASAQTLATMQSLLKPEMRGPNRAFDREYPIDDDAPVQDRMLAFSGRTP